jgi:hypothetical protein
MKNMLRLCGMLVSSVFALPQLSATTATSLSSFGGLEESAQKYFPSSNTFQSDSFANATDLGGGTFQMLLRYNSSGTMWWDGDRTTGNTDRQREEVKTLGAHQLIHQTFDYTTTWRTSSGFKGSGSFCHITQLKPVDGVEGSSGAPMVVTSIGSGSSSANVRYASASFSPANVFTAHLVRNITYTPNVFLAEKIRVTTTADGENTGQVVVSLNGDAFQGVTNTEVCRPSSTEYYPKWGLYRGASTSSGFGPNDYIQHSNVTAGPSGSTPTVANPTYSPAGGTYASAQSVTISTSTSGASIRYTTDGSTPTSTTGTLYAGPVTISTTTTLQAIAYESGFNNSSVTSATYTISLPQAAAPTFSPAGGTYTSAQSVTISTSTSGASIRYTTDGSTPTSTTGTLYAGPVTISATTTLKAIAYESGFTNSSVTSATYTISQPQAAAPTFSPAGGTYTSTQSVTISTATSGASIRYTTDGSTPTSTTGTLYSGPVTISATATLKAIAYESGFTDSSVTSATYTISTSPITIEAESMTFTTSGQTVTTGSDTNASGGVITYFNATGTGQYVEFTTPSLSAGTYQLQFRYKANSARGQHNVVVDGVQVGGTIDEYASASGYTTVTLGTATLGSTGTHTIRLTVTGKNASSTSYVIAPDSFILTPQSPQVSAPTFSPAGGTYSSAQSVSISTATSGATIRYTTDGSTPSQTNGTIYSGPVNIGSTTTLKAIAYASGMTNSSVTSATYTINIAPPPTVTMEAESLSFVTSGPTVTTQSDTNASGGVVTYFNATGTAQWVEYTTPSIVAGTYQIKFQYKSNTARGQHNLTIDGTQVGGTIDEYSTTVGYVSVTLGNATFASAGTHTIRLTVSGKNASSTAYTLAPDVITFVGQ